MSDESEALQHLRDMRRALNELITVLKKMGADRDLLTIRDDGPLERLTYSIPEAARICGLSKDYLRKLIYSGDLRAVKIGKRRLIQAVVLKEFIENR